MSPARLACVLAVGLALVTTTTAAHANDPVAAEALFRRGLALLAKGNTDEACDLFTRSEELDQGVGTLIHIGDCFERAKRYASAWGAFREAANLAIRKDDPRAADARDKALRMEPRLAKLTLIVAPIPPGASITRNGVNVDAAALNTAIPVDPGRQVIVVSAPGRKPWRGTVDVREGEAGTLQIPKLDVLPSAPAGPSTLPPPPPPPSPADADMPTQTKVALGLEIGGGIVLVTGLVFGALAINALSSVDQTCPGGRCSNAADRDRVDSDQKRASTFAAVSTVATAVGAAAVVTGVVLHLTSPSRSLSVAPTVDHAGGGFVATLRL
jgi:hypothetical protein